MSARQRHAAPLPAPTTLNDLGIVGLRRLITEGHFLFSARDLAWAKYWELAQASEAAWGARTKAVDAHHAASLALIGVLVPYGDGRAAMKRARLKSMEAKLEVERGRRERAYRRADAAARAFYDAHLAGSKA